ncbi:PolC-type DNA polymerase III [Mycoplasmopsis ciconiae]|uniref:DNA polymerase III PolC-type n=1 Tax=Mycoplasmopsis ciconiae TaxID=561067 RepID=A0ABU7MLI1_9BACT|nr:PolC-type DNA polymerase III [Mycoplasmopsis ciconiae]
MSNRFYKNNIFDKFAQWINLGELESLKNAYIEEDIQTTQRDNLTIFYPTIVFDLLPSASDFFNLENKIRNCKEPVFIPKYIFSDYYKTADIFYEYINLIITSDYKFHKLSPFVAGDSIRANNENDCWELHIDKGLINEEIQNSVLLVVDKMRAIGFSDFDLKIVEIKEDDTQVNEHQKQMKLSEQEFVKKLEQSAKGDFVKSLDNAFKDKINFSNSNFKSRTSSKEYITYTINNLNVENEIYQNKDFNVNLKGVVFSKDHFLSKNNYNVYTFLVHDFSDAIETKYISKIPMSEKINIGDSVEIFGNLTKNYANINYVMVDRIIKTADLFEKRSDQEKNKRVELSVRSKMNTMDGLLTPSEIIDIAKQFNHKAVALVDNNSVQGFPEFYHSAKKAGIKPIYGSSISCISKHNEAIYDYFDNFDYSQQIKECSYVSFDIETTGLSPRFDQIIEFGSVELNANEIINENQLFVKATIKLKDFTKNLTNITDQMLEEHGLEIREAMSKIHQLLNNKIAIAHNAKFDLNFVNQLLFKLNMPKLNTLFIDTMTVSRIVFPEKKKHTLESLAGFLGENYDEKIAHRADYDAKVLAHVWKLSITKLNNMGIYTFEDLKNYKDETLYHKKFSNEISFLALNQDGLKELFELVSHTLTKRYYSSPKLFIEEIKKSPNLLIGSSSLKGFLIDKLLFSSEYELRKWIQFFDYIEIPAPSDFNHYIESGDYTLEQIQQALKHLFDLSKEYNKIAVAVGDVRYKDLRDKLAYKMLVYSKGIGGETHYLYSYRKKDNLKLPDSHFQNTKEMLEQFAFLGNVQDLNDLVINNTNKIADLVSDITVIKDKLYAPNFDDSPNKLRDLVYKNAHLKYGENLPKVVEDRIKKELEPIIKYGFSVVYWISHILVKKSVENGYLVGSRGSVGSSLVATLSEITEVNPLEPHYTCDNCKYFELANIPGITSGYDLDDKNCPNCKTKMDKDGQTIPFETFLGFKANKVPDIDLNFSGEYQGEIHNTVRELFGTMHTFRAGTISTVAEKTSFGYVKNAVQENKWMYSNNFISYLSSKICGVKRTTGQHPGGIIIIPKEFSVEDFTPINYPADDTNSDWKTTHFDFHAIHDNVLKLDILGHLDPTAIRMLERISGINVRKDIPKKDKKVMSLFSSTKALNIKPEQIGNEPTGALGIPEFGTSFVRKMLEQANAQSFADLVSLSGLSHGTDVWLNNAQSLIVKEGKTLKDVICCRDDIMDYLIKKGVDPLESFVIMEQVRKGKSINPDQEKMLKEKNIPSWYIESMKKIKYMFPKAHATAYVLMAWRIAWFKIYKPLEYYATYFTTRCEIFDIENMVDDFGAVKINKRLQEINSKEQKERSNKEVALISVLELAREMYARGFKISNIDLNKSLENEWVVDHKNKSLIPPFNTIDGLGAAVAKSIVEARKQRSFMSIEDFKKRTTVNQTKINDFKRLGIFKDLDETDQISLFKLF